MKTMLLVFVATLLAVPSLALAQYPGQQGGYTIITPGKPPTFVNPNYNGGYTVTTPGQPPTFMNRTFNGGYTVITPGEPPTFINPTIPSAPSLPAFGGGGRGDYGARPFP
jgi:hypothetical protein